jgi:hypothetical protein
LSGGRRGGAAWEAQGGSGSPGDCASPGLSGRGAQPCCAKQPRTEHQQQQQQQQTNSNRRNMRSHWRVRWCGECMARREGDRPRVPS